MALEWPAIAYLALNEIAAIGLVVIVAVIVRAGPRRRLNLFLATYLACISANFAAQGIYASATRPFLLANSAIYATLTGILLPILDLSAVLYYAPTAIGSPRAVADVAENILSPLAGIAFVTLLARALLRDQLFDFDLKLKLNIQRGTIAAVFLAVFLVVAQLIQNVASQALGYIGGAIAAGLLLFALKPLERAAERFASKAMPRTTGSPEYIAFRKLEVYKAAVESALEVRGIDPKEREVLAHLRQKLGIEEEDAYAVEVEATARLGPAARTDAPT